MQAVDFEYDGRLLSELGMEIVQFDSGSGFDTTTAGSQLSLDTFPVNGGREHRLVAAHYDDVFTATISVCKPDGATISINEYRYIMHWLNRKTNLKLTILFDEWENIHFYGTFDNIEKVEHRGRLVGFNLSFQSNAPFGWGDQITESFELTEENGYVIDDNSDEYGNIPFDQMEITCNESGQLSLRNNCDGRATVFTDCQNGEVITIDGKTLTVKSSTGRDIYNHFNFVYPRLVSATHIDDLMNSTSDNAEESSHTIPIANTVNGSIVSFDDGVDNVPVKSLTVSMEPIQDLHGYDSPWPARGGKNKYDISGFISETRNGVTVKANSDGTLTVTGTPTATTDIALPYFTSAVSGETYILNGSPTGGSNKWKLDVRSNGTYYVDSGNGVSFEAEDSESIQVRIVIYVAAGSNLNMTFKPMIRLASVTDATYAPYENICPISGHTQAVVTRSGANLLPFSDIGEGWTNTADGVTATYSNGVMHIEGLHNKSGWTNVVNLALWNANKIRLPSGIRIATPDTVSGATSITLYANVDGVARNLTNGSIIDSGATALVHGFYIAIQGEANFNFDVPMIVTAGATRPTVYEPYSSQSITVQFGRTVYGVSVDAVSGKLTVGRASINISDYLSSLRDNGTRMEKQLIAMSVPEKKPGVDNFVSNLFYVTSATPTNYVMHGRATTTTVEFEIPFSALGVTEEDPVDVRLTASKQWFTNNPTQLCYELDEPISVELIPQQLTTLLGQNNIWSDAGDVTVTYEIDGAIVPGQDNIYTSTLPCTIYAKFTPIRKVVF